MCFSCILIDDRSDLKNYRYISLHNSSCIIKGLVHIFFKSVLNQSESVLPWTLKDAVTRCDPRQTRKVMKFTSPTVAVGDVNHVNHHVYATCTVAYTWMRKVWIGIFNGSDGSQHPSSLFCAQNVFKCVSKTNMRLQQSEFVDIILS